MTVPKDFTPIRELISLDGKRAIVTGGAMGIGYAISYRLAESGAAVLIADIDNDEAQKAVEQLVSYGYGATSVHCDVSQAESVKSMVSTAVERMGGVDILVNNAGIYPRTPLPEMTPDSFEEVIAVNLKGTFLCSQEVGLRMIEKRQGGCIINIASIDAIHPSSKGLSAYDASKGGVLTLTKSLALELGQHDIRVNAIAPGGIMTRGVRSHLVEPSKEGARAQLKELKAFISRMALGRMGRADDIGRVALFLASDLASYMTGALVVVDGGYLIS